MIVSTRQKHQFLSIVSIHHCHLPLHFFQNYIIMVSTINATKVLAVFPPNHPPIEGVLEEEEVVSIYLIVGEVAPTPHAMHTHIVTIS